LTSIQLISQLLGLGSVELNLSIESIALISGLLLDTTSLFKGALSDLLLVL
jgi:hypothetical protein